MQEHAKPLSVTEAAVARAKYLMGKRETPPLGLRIGVKSGGCSGLQYVIEYADEEKPFEEVVETDGVKFFIDPMATMYLLGSQMDYVESKLESGFVFNNPNVTDSCGCGESFRV